MTPARPVLLLRRVRSFPARPWGPATQLRAEDLIDDLAAAYRDALDENGRLRAAATKEG